MTTRRRGKPLPITWTARARHDLDDIADYIARDDVHAAERWVAALVQSVEKAAQMPRAGRVVPEIGRDDIREVLRGNYRIVYRLRADLLEVLTIFEGHRLLPRRSIPD